MKVTCEIKERRRNNNTNVDEKVTLINNTNVDEKVTLIMRSSNLTANFGYVELEIDDKKHMFLMDDLINALQACMKGA